MIMLSRFGGGHAEQTIFCLAQSTDNDLQTNDNEVLGFGSNSSSGTHQSRQNIWPRQMTARRFVIRITQGDHDQVITLTLEINQVSSAKLITIPASAGVATYTDDTDLEYAALEMYDVIIEVVGAGAGTTTMRGFSQEFVYNQ